MKFDKNEIPEPRFEVAPNKVQNGYVLMDNDDVAWIAVMSDRIVKRGDLYDIPVKQLVYRRFGNGVGNLLGEGTVMLHVARDDDSIKIYAVEDLLGVVERALGTFVR